LSSVELIPVSVTLSLGGLGVACAEDDGDGDGDVAAGPAQAATAMALTSSATKDRRISFPLPGQHRGGTPAEQPCLHALGDLDQCDSEDHEDEQDEIHAFGVEQARGDVQAVAQAG